MSPRAVNSMIHRTYRQMIEAEDFGLRLHWMWRRNHYISRRRAAVLDEATA